MKEIVDGKLQKIKTFAPDDTERFLQPLGSEIVSTGLERWLSVKCLSHKHKDLSSDPHYGTDLPPQCCQEGMGTSSFAKLSGQQLANQ